jgi:hypothetical protein
MASNGGQLAKKEAGQANDECGVMNDEIKGVQGDLGVSGEGAECRGILEDVRRDEPPSRRDAETRRRGDAET